MEYLNKLKNSLDLFDIYYVGCSEEEILNIQRNMLSDNDKFPNCYIEFLENFGKDMDRKEGKSRGYLVGNSVFIDDLEINNGPDGLRGLLEDDESTLQVPETAFVFYGSQGILYAFFKLDEGDNPPVYGYEEGYNGSNFPKIADTLSDFYERYIEEDKTLFKELRIN